MDKRLTIRFTSDIHGHVFPTNYRDRILRPMGALGLIGLPKGENTLVIDGGDTLQGSPLTYFCHRQGEKSPMAEVLNAMRADYVTIGNHDLNYGYANLADYLEDLNAQCLSCNIQGTDGRLQIASWTVRVLENGWRIGLVGAATDWIRRWERPENLRNVRVEDTLESVKRAFKEVKSRSDFTVLIYHGGIERDLQTGEILSNSGENIACRICEEAPFDLLLTGHQHIPLSGARWKQTHLVQAPANATGYVEIEWLEDGSIRSRICPIEPCTDAPANVEAIGRRVEQWLDSPVCRFDAPLWPQGKLEMALHGTPIANLINRVQLEASGADVSSTSLANDVRGFDREATVRDVVATYVFPNTLAILRVTGAQLKLALERSAAYFHPLPDGGLEIAEEFLRPKIAHYNYDFFYGLEYAFDLDRPVGERVVRMERNGKPIDAQEEFKLCVNSYRATGVGGYAVLAQCERVGEIQTEISEILLNYLLEHRNVSVPRAANYRVQRGGIVL